MSLITRCPACETLFRVVPDQLRISEGWVRCGQCDEIFDASLHLLPASTAPDPIASAPAAAPTPAAPPLEPSAEPPIDIDLDINLDEVEADAAAFWPAGQAISAPADLSSVPPDDWQAPAPGPATAPGLSGADPDAGEPDVSFLRGKRTGAFWHRPRVRVTLVVLSVLLLATLAGQIVLQERDRLAASQPGLAPWLRGFCRAFNCTLSPLRQIDALVIESSSFSRVEGDTYRLNFTLKNTATSALAVPALELTMTDALDQPVLRRVLLADELGATQDTLAAGAEWPVNIALSVNTAGQAQAVAGYRLLVFYP